MADTAFEIRMSSAAEGAPQSGSVFLCHNSRDKPDVKRIADALELEFGTAFFLDAYAIPTGEAFLPWIERALANCVGCSCFPRGERLGPDAPVGSGAGPFSLPRELILQGNSCSSARHTTRRHAASWVGQGVPGNQLGRFFEGCH